MMKHLFGATSSPSCVNFCLQKTALTYQEKFEPDTIQTVMRNMYVDDLMKSVSSPEAAIKLSTQLRELLMKGGFRLTKWLCNDRDVLVEIPEHERASSVVNLDIEDLPTACTLGLKWNVEADKFIWDVSTKFKHLVETKPVTRRGILAIVSSTSAGRNWAGTLQSQNRIESSGSTGLRTFQSWKTCKLIDASNQRTLPRLRMLSCTFSQMDQVWAMGQ